MKDAHRKQVSCGCCRREFLHTVGLTAGAVGGLSASVLGAGASEEKPPASKKLPAPQKGTATVLGAFVYPPSESLRKKGYWSAPGVDFDAAAWDAFARRIHYFPGDATSHETYPRLSQRIAELSGEHGTESNVLFYLAVAPSLCEPIVGCIDQSGLVLEGRRWCSLDRDSPTPRRS